MVEIEHKLTVDDLIVEYMICKIENGNEHKFLASEFILFLQYFENQMAVEDSIYDGEKLFNRFFERKSKSHWATTVNYKTMEKRIIPHMDMKYSEEDKDFIISANYNLSCYDRSIINTYFMKHKEIMQIRNIIKEFLKQLPKRQIDMSTTVESFYILMGKYLAAEIVDNIWKGYVKEQIKNHKWPIQCIDIDKYLLQIDLAEIIGLKSIKKELLEMYEVISKRIAILFKQDNNLKISSSHSYMALANYKLLISGYEDLFKMAFGQYKSSFLIDMEQLAFTKNEIVQGTYDYGDDSEIKSTTILIGNAPVKKLVRNLDNSISNK